MIKFLAVLVFAFGLGTTSQHADARFLSVDPVPPSTDTGANFNRYWYANNNPYKFTDPDGRESGCIYGGGCGGMASDTQNAVFGAALDFVPVVGDLKGIVEAIADPSAANIAGAVVGLAGPIGDSVAAAIKGADKVGGALKAAGDNPQKLVSNPKHHANSSSPEPKNAAALYDNSIADKSGVRWAKDADGTTHRFSKPSNGESHWNGSTAGEKPIQERNIPNEIKKQLE